MQLKKYLFFKFLCSLKRLKATLQVHEASAYSCLNGQSFEIAEIVMNKHGEVRVSLIMEQLGLSNKVVHTDFYINKRVQEVKIKTF